MKSIRPARIVTAILAASALYVSLGIGFGRSQASETLMVRGQPQALRLYGVRGGQPVIVSSGDGGWIHLGPHIAEVLAARGFFVIGFDVRAYLEQFTSAKAQLNPSEVPGDYRQIIEFAARGSGRKPLLVGVSEGAGLSVLAASDPQTQALAAGVIGVGLPNVNELGWRWKDAIIYLTHKAPNEPTFTAASIIQNVAPLPLAAIHSTRDEYVPSAEAQALLDKAKEPKRLWLIDASDHRFSDNLAEFDARLIEAVAWVGTHATR